MLQPMTIEVLAIELENTLTTIVVNRQPRPGLHDYLALCLDTLGDLQSWCNPCWRSPERNHPLYNI